MDMQNLWNDDPEEVLLDLGFGCDEPYLSGRIPVRFINHQSQARGVDIQVFLEAQKNRLDLENPDVNNLSRQLEALQQATTAFSSLVKLSSTRSRQLQRNALLPGFQKRRKRISKLFRLVLKKSLRETHNNNNQDLTIHAATSPPCTAPGTLLTLSSNGGKKVLLKKPKPGLQQTVFLSLSAEEQEACPDTQALSDVASLIAQENERIPRSLREDHHWSANTFLQIHSFDESCATGSYTRGAENFESIPFSGFHSEPDVSEVQEITQSTSCQSDSMNFLEKLSVPSISLLASPRFDLIKISYLKAEFWKDIPYMTDPQCSLHPSVLPLNTSIPFHAVQSWPDLRIQQNIVTKIFSHAAFHTVPKNALASMSASETTQGPTMIFSLSPPFPQTSINKQSYNCLLEMAFNHHTESVSVDKRLWPDEEEGVHRNVKEDKKRLWWDSHTFVIADYCKCDQKCVCCTRGTYKEQHTVQNLPYSLDELEEMVPFLQRYCSVQCYIEKQLSEDQTAVYSDLSELDRKKIKDLRELRKAVKAEAAELEMQLAELAHCYVDSLKMEVLECLMDVRSEIKDDEEEEILCTENQETKHLTKPRRKDTPFLNTPPHIPGAGLVKAEKQMVHLENEEKDVKD